MQPAKTSATLLFNAPTQYVIPVFKHGYVWTLEKQVALLWADVKAGGAQVENWKK